MDLYADLDNDKKTENQLVVYQRVFEDRFLEESVLYFVKMAEASLQIDSIPVYMRKVELFDPLFSSYVFILGARQSHVRAQSL